MPLASRAKTVIEAKLSPEGTRRATLFEQLTVRRVAWDTLVRLNRWLSALGKLATSLYCCVIAALVIGVDIRPAVQDALNSGKPIEHVFVLAILLPTLVFLLARSMIGWMRWKVQRELWRRDVERLGGTS
ncbi:hypothetical protein OJ997_21840 [Solirubrobacter phytolaccae]|uniref:Uncharacterized protein n=1 Tax=Solirubrobacter phytolaccae TaxID=1404360 RepID=A0A9X3NKC3_9ACTN|nr:hypothetical protein [Solirubrobacter phytolaccae]MDA0182967.1 hypothetical protein [Solirubrobacter phytolaccae]